MELGHEPRRKFTTDEVLRMVAAGILGEDDRVELIEGELLAMSPQEPVHASAVQRLSSRLVKAMGDRYQVRVQFPLVASHDSLPEPDVAVLLGDERAFEKRHPRGNEAVLVVEVTWSTATRDRKKADLYARAGVPVYWRLDLEHRRLEVHEAPAPDGLYTRVHALGEADEVGVPTTQVSWRVADLLPAP
jgi:Uma2 family endonuclease